MVQQHAVGDATAAIVTGNHELLEAQRLHHLDLIVGGGALAVNVMFLVARRFGAIAVTTQIGHDAGEMLGQTRRDLVPHHVGFRVTMQ
jgi:hypothetical protein